MDEGFIEPDEQRDLFLQLEGVFHNRDRKVLMGWELEVCDLQRGFWIPPPLWGMMTRTFDGNLDTIGNSDGDG
jgi:hypothetical protein